MPRYRVDVYLHDNIRGAVSHAGGINVDAPNKQDAEEQGYDWFWMPEWPELGLEAKVFVQRVPKVRGVQPDNVIIHPSARKVR